MVHDGLYCSIADAGWAGMSDAENVRLGVTREAQDMLALRSHERAAAATAEGRLADEIVPLPELAQDEGIRDGHLAGAARRAAARLRRGRDDHRRQRLAGVRRRRPRRIVTTLGARAPRASSRSPRSSAARSSPAPTPACTCVPPRPREKLLARHGLSARRHRPVGDQRGLRRRRGRLRRGAGHRPRARQRQRRRRRDRPSARGLRHATRAHLAYEMRRRGAELGVATLCGGGGQGEAMLLRR